MNPDCHYGDHSWHGGGTCVRCGKQLRCICGQFVREDGIEAHMEVCPVVLAAPEGATGFQPGANYPTEDDPWGNGSLEGATEKVTHGRHCTCSSCKQEDWTRITAPCGMHGSSCPAVYDPRGFAGDLAAAPGGATDGD